MNNKDEYIILCPFCGDLVQTTLSNGRMDVENKCSCVTEGDMKFEEWIGTIYQLWGDFTILKLPDELDIKDELIFKEKSLMEWQEHIHEIAMSKGWYDEKRTFGEIISLIHSELSESLEEHRNDMPDLYYEEDKPEGWGVELVDTIIRILDFLGDKGIDTEYILKEKCDYNKTREHRHGGKKL